MNATLPAEVEDFLRRLRAALAHLPPEDCADIVAEVRGHLVERPVNGPDQLLARFGAPEDYAASFVSAHAISGALARGTSVALGRALLVGVRDTLLDLLLIVPLLLSQLLAAALILAGGLKPLLPERVGLFTDEAGQFRALGVIAGDPSRLHELLGWWALPAFILPGILGLWLGNRALRAMARRRLARKPARAS